MGGIMGLAVVRLLFAATGLTQLEPSTQVGFGFGSKWCRLID
jgi:hypothetical protein